MQKELEARSAELPENRRMRFRIGINLGDVIEEEESIYGDGVNIAARLESLADPGAICVSKTAFEQIEAKLPLGYEFLGEQTVKNIVKPVGAYKVVMEPMVTVKAKAGSKSRDGGSRKPLTQCQPPTADSPLKPQQTTQEIPYNALISGSPGAGKTMLTQRLPGILPLLSYEEALETSKVFSAAGLLNYQPLLVQRPFGSPHHTISDAGLVGGGHVPRPGEVSLAHTGRRRPPVKAERPRLSPNSQGILDKVENFHSARVLFVGFRCHSTQPCIYSSARFIWK